MVVPYIPAPLAVPILNPAVGSSGASPLPYLSTSQFAAAPTGLDANHLVPGGTAIQSLQSLADVIRRASRWCDDICFGTDPAAKGASLAASLSVQSARVRIKSGQLRLLCDYRPVIEVVGIAVGTGLSSLNPLDASVASFATVGRRTITIPYGPGFLYRSGDVPALVPFGASVGSVYAVWSYVNGYPHTKLVSSVSSGATSCVVAASDGNGGLWGVFPASGAFPGTELTVVDGALTERVFVQGITPNTPSPGQTTLQTSAFESAHTVPSSPDFIPVTAIPEEVGQAVISLASVLIKTRGTRALVMSSTPGGRPSQQAIGQAGAMEDFKIAKTILSEGGYRVRVKASSSY